MSKKISDIPKELRERPQWVLWRREKRDGDWTKVPYQPSGAKANSTDLATWSAFDDVLRVARASSDRYNGIGFVFSSADPFVGVDLDDCIIDGGIEPWAQEVCEHLRTYTEVSPSGAGLHAVCKGKKPGKRCTAAMPSGGKLEIYDNGRYLTFTADILDAEHSGVEERSEEITVLYNEHLARKPSNSNGRAHVGGIRRNGEAEAVSGPGNDLGDEAVIEKARDGEYADEFAALFDDGDTSLRDGDDSRADYALCSHLGFYTGGDPEQIERLFGRSPLAAREKWTSRADYRQRTIQKALDAQSEFYTPPNGHDANDADDATGEKQKQRSLATKAVDLVAERADLYHSGRTMQLARRKVDGQNLLLDSDAFQHWVSDLYMEKHDKALPSSSFKDALSVLKGKATKTEHTAHVRTCGDLAEQVVYLNLGEGRIAEVTPERVEIKSATEYPVRFWEPQAAKPLPEPDLSGTLDDVGKALSLDGDALLVAVGWLLAAFLPVGELPVLAARGPQGSGKSTRCRQLALLIDPSAILLRTPPKNLDDLIVSARATHVLAYDNLSQIRQWLSDGLCRLASGTGIAKRRLFTNLDVSVVSVRRPVIINAITDVVKENDLADRLMLLELPRISERKTKRQVEARFHRLWPKALGAVLKGVQAAVANFENTTVPHVKRMADACLWAEAGIQGLGREKHEFFNAYRTAHEGAHERIIESDLLGSLIVALAKKDGEWSGTSSKLLTRLKNMAKDQSDALPPDATRLSQKLRELDPALREGCKVAVDFTRTPTKRIIEIASLASLAS